MRNSNRLLSIEKILPIENRFVPLGVPYQGRNNLEKGLIMSPRNLPRTYFKAVLNPINYIVSGTEVVKSTYETIKSQLKKL